MHTQIQKLAQQAMDEAMRIETWAYQLERPASYLETAKGYRELSANLSKLAVGA